VFGIDGLSTEMSKPGEILSHDSEGFHLAKTWQMEPIAGTDPLVWAVHYLQALRDLAVEADWIVVANGAAPPTQALTGIGQYIYAINRRLDAILQDFLRCLQDFQQPQIQIFAAPILPQVGVDGFCNFQVAPVTLMVDPSRVIAADWPHLVAHELAHSMAQTLGHGEAFQRAIAHLCLAHDLPLPPANSLDTDVLRYWPPCRQNPESDRFWFDLAQYAQAP
jgi:hypothetical protein